LRLTNAVFAALLALPTLAGTFTIRTYVPQLPPYVTNGLIHCWDAQHNNGLDKHVGGVAPVWKDLVGTKDLMPAGTGAFFTAHSLYCPPRGYYDRTRAAGIYRTVSSIGDSAVTVEVAVNPTPAGASPWAPLSGYSIFVSDGAVRSYYGGFGDQYSSAAHFVGMARNDSGALYAIVNKAWGNPVYLTYWNSESNGNVDSGASFMSKVQGGFTVSESNTNRTDDIMYINSVYRRTEVYVKYYGMGGGAYTNVDELHDTWCGSTGGQQYPRFVSSSPTGTGFSVAGSMYNGSQYNLFVGWIYCIRVYNRRLTLDERKQNALVDYGRFKNVKETN